MKELDDWFLANRRSFPWRANPTPYRVWISEVMLQQTRAQVVIAYFERWMELFPDLESLAQAPLDQVIKVWEGLGYYSRARNLHKGAQHILREFGGQIPSSEGELLKISGLGPYTASAILSFGFHKRAAAVDGNVLRVASRFFWIEEDVGKASVRKKIALLCDEILDLKKPWITAEALIELGATICQPKPRCSECPLQFKCKAALQKSPESLPIKARMEKIERLIRGVAIVESGNFILVRKNGPGQVMADLYEFPYFEGVQSLRAVQKEVESLIQMGAKSIGKLSQVEHSFTRFRASLFPYHYRIERRVEVMGYDWIDKEQLGRLPFSSGHKKIMGQLQ